MTTPTILVATWRDGIFVFAGNSRKQELADHTVTALVSDARGRVLAIVNGHSLYRRDVNGAWSTLCTSEFPLACAVAVGENTFIGTDDARILQLSASGQLTPLSGFDTVPGRSAWYAGSALIDGEVVGPPLGVRSITATSNGGELLANVHVGGIPRSTDGGVSWHPTIAVANDVHEVVAHPVYPDVVIAAAATGLWISRDSGVTWSHETEGLHASYCSAVAFSGDDILVSASEDHFAAEAAVYRRPIHGREALALASAGLPAWLDGIVDTRCIATRASTVAMADHGGNLYRSVNGGETWLRLATGIAAPCAVVIAS